MAVSKDIEKGTWTSQVWVEDWQGKKKHKKKRGFATKKEALEWEHSILLAAKADMNMKLADFVDLYFRDKETELKARTVRNKRYMIEQHVAPMLGDKPMDGITPADIIQWQNYIRSKGFKETYQRMLQNQLTALFTHATKIYNLKDNPCAKVKRIGKADADKKQLQFWTLDEFSKFIATFEEGSRYHVLFDLLFYSGCRIGEALALMPKDFDLTNRKVSITKTYFRHKGVDEITEPKTEESIRTVIIPEFLVDEIKEYMESMYKLPENEAERRVLIDDTRWYHMLSMNIMGANWKIFETMQGLEDDEILEEIDQRLSQYVGHVNADKIPDNYYVDINNLPKYILGVKVNPFAEKWYVDLIENLCAEYDLKFLGQSELYKSGSVN